MHRRADARCTRASGKGDACVGDCGCRSCNTALQQLQHTLETRYAASQPTFQRLNKPAGETHFHLSTVHAGRGRLTHSVVAMTQKSGLASLLYSSLGETEVLDDLLDFWSARVHAMEKEAVLHMLQDMALARGFRFSFMSGHARVAAVGRVLSAPQVATRTDHRFMPQVRRGRVKAG